MLGIDTAKTMEGLTALDNHQQIETFLQHYAIHGDIMIDPRVTPWCAAIMNAFERSVNNPGTGRLNAQSFLDYGEVISLENAKRGDIVIFHFTEDSEAEGHVTYFDSWDPDEHQVYCLGGNQSGMIRESNYSTECIQGIRRHA